MTTLECISRSEVLLAPPKYNLSTTMRISHGRALRIWIANGIEDMPLKRTSAINGIGILINRRVGLLLCQGMAAP